MSVYVINPYAFGIPDKFWVPTQPAIPVTLTGFSATKSGGGSITVSWGDGTTQVLTSGVATNKTFNASTSGIDTDSQATMTAINCGTSSPKLGGVIDISDYLNLQDFRCQNNDITAISGYENNTNLQRFWCFTNKLTGSIPSLDALINLQDFRCQNQTASNKLTGSIPSLSGLSNLQFFQCSQNQLTGSIPSLSGLSNLKVFQCFTNELTGPIPSLNGLSNLEDFRCFTNQLTGSIPSLSGLNKLQDFQCQNQTASEKLTGSIPSLDGLINLITFYCSTNQLTGQIPSLNGLNKLEDFRCSGNQLTGFAGGSVPNTLGSFLAQSNQLTQSAVNAILAAFVAANKTTGTRVLDLGGTGNAAPTGQGLVDKQTLLDRGWRTANGSTAITN